MCRMHIINGDQRSSGGNTSSNPLVTVFFSSTNGMERMCQSYGSNHNSHPSVLTRKPSCYQFIYHHISSRWVFAINHVKLRDFADVAIECSFATFDRCSITARIHRWSMVIYNSLQAEFMENKYNSHIHKYGKYVLSKIVVNKSKPINNNNQIFWRL